MWLANGLSKLDVMQFAGPADFETTYRFYLAVRRDLIDRARAATVAAVGRDSDAHVAGPHSRIKRC